MTKAKKPPTAKIKIHDWVGLRALYLILASDTSSATVREVQRILRYYENIYTTAVVQQAMSLLVRDNALRGTFDNPEADMSRRLDRAIKITLVDKDFPDFFEEVKL